MYKKNRIDKDKNALPTWLKDDNAKGKVAESKPLIPNIAQASSYGGQSTGGASNSSSSPVEEDYGEPQFGVMGGTALQDEIDPSWAVDSSAANKKIYGTNQIEFDHSESSEEDDSFEDEDSQGDSDSEDTEEDNDDEELQQHEEAKWLKETSGRGSAKGQKRNKSWHEESERKKTKKSKRKKKKKNDREALVDSVDVAVVPRRTCCHSLFIIIQFIAILANIAIITFQLVPIFIGTLDPLDKVLRCYFSIFSTFFLLAELELIKTGLDNWMIRGFLYTFLGVVVKEQHLAMLVKGSIPKEYWDGVRTNLLMEVLSWWMIGIGCVYFLFGALCLKVIRDRCREQYQSKCQEYTASKE